jgi:exodeoxyribonuclease-3
MKIISWNVNSIRARLDNFIAVAKEFNPDVFLLQETRVDDPQFPFDMFDVSGYNIEIKGQKGRNGVAIFSKHEIDLIDDNFCEEARFLHVFTGGIFTTCVYVPNGQEVGAEQYYYKLEFLENLKKYMMNLKNEIYVVGGDFNVAPYPKDVYIKNYNGIAGSEPERQAIANIRDIGFNDMLSNCGYTWWSYRQRDFKLNNGFRLDHFYMSPKAQNLFVNGRVLTEVREQKRPSDHAPIYCELNL